MNNKNYEETTPIYNEVLEDKLLTAEEKLTYIYLMKYQRFEGNEKTFLSWLSSKGIRSKTFSKYVKSLQEKKYISVDSVGNYLFYAVNREGETINYNNQNFKSFFSNNYYTAVKNEIIFSSKLSIVDKLIVILLERENKISKDKKNYKVHFSTIQNSLSLTKNYIYKRIGKLKELNILSYEVGFTSRSNRSSFIKDLVINYDNLKGENKTTDNEFIDFILKQETKENEEKALGSKDFLQEQKDFEGNKEHVPMKEELKEAIQKTKENCYFKLDLYSLYGRTINNEPNKNKRIALSEMWKAYNNNEVYQETNNYIKAYKPYLLEAPEIDYNLFFEEACKDFEESYLYNKA